MGSISNLCRVFGLARRFHARRISATCADAAKPNLSVGYLPGAGLSRLRRTPIASRLLDGARPFVMSSRPLRRFRRAGRAVPLRSFKSFDEIRDALETNALSPDVKGILYDYEKWRFTPAEEQQNPARISEAGCRSCSRSRPAVPHRARCRSRHDSGAGRRPKTPGRYLFAIGPCRRRCTLRRRLRRSVATVRARHRALRKFRPARPRRKPVRQIRRSWCSPASAPSRAASMSPPTTSCGPSTRPAGFVDGYWFNIPEPSEYSPAVTEFRPDIAVDVLRQLAER